MSEAEIAELEVVDAICAQHIGTKTWIIPRAINISLSLYIIVYFDNKIGQGNINISMEGQETVGEGRGYRSIIITSEGQNLNYLIPYLCQNYWFYSRRIVHY